MNIKNYRAEVSVFLHTLVFNVKSKLRVNSAETPERVDHKGLRFVEKMFS